MYLPSALTWYIDQIKETYKYSSPNISTSKNGGIMIVKGIVALIMIYILRSGKKSNYTNNQADSAVKQEDNAYSETRFAIIFRQNFNEIAATVCMTVSCGRLILYLLDFWYHVDGTVWLVIIKRVKLILIL